MDSAFIATQGNERTGSVREQASVKDGLSEPKLGSSSEAVFTIWGLFGVKEAPQDTVSSTNYWNRENPWWPLRDAFVNKNNKPGPLSGSRVPGTPPEAPHFLVNHNRTRRVPLPFLIHRWGGQGQRSDLPKVTQLVSGRWEWNGNPGL